MGVTMLSSQDRSRDTVCAQQEGHFQVLNKTQRTSQSRRQNKRPLSLLTHDGNTRFNTSSEDPHPPPGQRLHQYHLRISADPQDPSPSQKPDRAPPRGRKRLQL